MLLTPEKNYKIQIFSAFVAEVDDPVWERGFSDEDYAKWLSRLKRKSMFESPVEAALTDRVITLATCGYEFSDARFVVLGVLEEG